MFKNVLTIIRNIIIFISHQGVERTMLINHDREKLLNAMVYFAKNTKYCGRLKIFKLLYLLDFEHFKEIGRSVTGLNYVAWDNGPVPRKLYYEMKSPPKDITDKISIDPRETVHEQPLMLNSAKTDFDPSHFSRREIRLLDMVSQQCRDLKEEDIKELTHSKKEPWHQVYEVEGNKNKEIPYEYGVCEDDLGLIRDMATKNKEMIDNYK